MSDEKKDPAPPRKDPAALAGVAVGMDRAELMKNPDVLRASLEELTAAVADFRRRVSLLPFDALGDVFQYERDFGCFFDPTGWSRARDEKTFNAELVAAVATFYGKVAAMMAKRHGCQNVHAMLCKGFPCPLCGTHGEGAPPGDDAVAGAAPAAGGAR